VRFVITNNEIDGIGYLECYVPCTDMVNGKKTSPTCSVPVPATISPDLESTFQKEIDSTSVDPLTIGPPSNITDPEDEYPTSSTYPDNSGSTTNKMPPQMGRSPVISGFQVETWVIFCVMVSSPVMIICFLVNWIWDNWNRDNFENMYPC